MDPRDRGVAGAVSVLAFDDHRQASADGDELDLRGGQPGLRGGTQRQSLGRDQTGPGRAGPGPSGRA